MSDVLLHFVAGWADQRCRSHRSEVAKAAASFGLTVRELEIDDHHKEAREYKILNVPAVVIEGIPESLIVGAVATDQLIECLTPFANNLRRPTG